jgi:hypothetical protein
MGLSWDTEQAKPLVHLFPHDLHEEILLLLCQNVEVHHIVATFIFVLQETHPLNAVIIHFLENSFNTELLNIPH